MSNKKVVVISTSLRAGSNSHALAERFADGWIDCYEKCALKGHLFCGGVNDPKEIAGNAKLREAYELGKNI